VRFTARLALAVPITDLSWFPQLTTANQIMLGPLPQLRDLSGTPLVSLGTLNIYNCPALTSLHGLEGVHELRGSLQILSATALTSLAGLESVVNVDYLVYIVSCPQLTSLDGLARLRSIGEGGLILGGLPGVTSLSAFGALETVAGDLQVDSLRNVPDDEITAFVQRFRH
jgi:hypothetical protein